MSALPVEVLRRILRFVTRDDIECAMLASRQLRAILEAHPKDMPQRAIEEARVEIENESAEGPFLVTLRTPAKTLTVRQRSLLRASGASHGIASGVGNQSFPANMQTSFRRLCGVRGIFSKT